MGNVFYRERAKQKRKYYIIIVLIFCLVSYLYFFNIRNKKGVFMTKEADNKRNNANMNEELPTWNLDDLYSSINDEQIDKDLKTVEKKIDTFVKTYKESIKYLSSSVFYKSLREYEEINEMLVKLISFADLKYAEDSSKTENVIFYQKITEKTTFLSAQLIFYSLEINKLENWELRDKIAGNKNLIKRYYQFLQNMRALKKYQLNESLEKLMAEKDLTSGSAMVRLFDETSYSMVYKLNGKDYNEAEILKIINFSKDEKLRKEAGKIFGETLGKNIKLYTFIYNMIAKDKSISDGWRGFKSPVSSRNISNMIEDKVVDNLEKSVEENYKNTSHRYYKLKAKILNKQKLHHTDRNSPLPFNSEKKYSWQETKDIVLASYRSFSPEMAEIGELFFKNGWIDVPPRIGKSAGAFMHPTVPSVHPYILLNFQGTEDDIMTLAHELGHGIHQYLSKNGGLFYSEAPLTIAETASVFGEQLAFRYILNRTTDKNHKISLIANKIQSMLNTVVRQIAFYKFEKQVHSERKNGELTADRISEIWLKTQRESLGDIFEFDEEYKYYWAYVKHFFHYPFYVYSYAFGDCLVNSLYMKYMSGEEDFVNKYIELLKLGGSYKYTELLEPFNLDPRNEDFWNNGMKLIIQLIDELEKLVNEK